MQSSESDFLTHKQRVKFIGGIIPLITILIIPAVVYSATNKLLIVCISLVPPIVGVTFLRLSVRKEARGELFFKMLPVAINGFISFLTCWLSGAAAPSFLIGIPLIGACTLIFSDIRHLIMAIIYSLIAITLGSYLAGKNATDIVTYFVLLFCYSFILVRMLQFTVLQGNEIISSQKKIEEQKRLIEEKQKDILDSIHYAKRIQKSLMPTDKHIEKVIGRLRK